MRPVCIVIGDLIGVEASLFLFVVCYLRVMVLNEYYLV